jgi:hypothetical protein
LKLPLICSTPVNMESSCEKLLLKIAEVDIGVSLLFLVPINPWRTFL